MIRSIAAAAVVLLGAAGYTFGAPDGSPLSGTEQQTASVSNLSESDGASVSGKDGSSGEDLTVHFVDIGQGDCMVLTQGDHAMLIDAGDNSKGTAVQSYLEYLGIGTLDYAVLTHPDADHIGGADVVLYKFDCERVLMPDVSADTRTYEDVMQVIEDKNLAVDHPSPGDVYAFGGASFTVLSPSGSYRDTNDNSIVIRLVYGDTSFLFTGDAEEAAEEDMLASGLTLSSDVLKVGHHGSSSSTGDAFLEAVDPSFAIISCGEDNSYGHPHAETLNKLRAAGVSVFRTDEQGTITAVTDGTTITWNASPSETWQSGR